MPELEQAEQAALQAFEDALAEPMAGAAKTLVARQLEILRATHVRFAKVARRAAEAQGAQPGPRALGPGPRPLTLVRCSARVDRTMR